MKLLVKRSFERLRCRKSAEGVTRLKNEMFAKRRKARFFKLAASTT